MVLGRLVNILGIIPARGGSKGLPGKNIKKLAGKPLIKFSIESAKQSRINKILVTTDDKKIAKIAKSAGAEVPFLRPKSLSSDRSSIIEVVKHSLKFLKDKQSYIPDIIILLQPTSPLRNQNLIDKSISKLTRSNCTSVISVLKIKTHPYSAFWFKKNYLKPFRKDYEKFERRQKIPSLYYPTGSVYTFWYDTLKKFNSMYGTRIKPIIEENQLDIDNNFDFFLAEMTLLKWKNSKKFSNRKM